MFTICNIYETFLSLFFSLFKRGIEIFPPSLYAIGYIGYSFGLGELSSKWCATLQGKITPCLPPISPLFAMTEWD